MLRTYGETEAAPQTRLSPTIGIPQDAQVPQCHYHDVLYLSCVYSNKDEGCDFKMNTVKQFNVPWTQSWSTLEWICADFNPTQKVERTSIATNNTLPASPWRKQPSMNSCSCSHARIHNDVRPPSMLPCKTNRYVNISEFLNIAFIFL